MTLELNLIEATGMVFAFWKIFMATTQLNIRVDPKDLAALKKACQETGQDQSDILRACIKAFVERVQEDGEVTRPFAIVSKKLVATVQKKSVILQGGAGVPAEKSRSTASTAKSTRQYRPAEEKFPKREVGLLSEKPEKFSDG